MNALELVRIHLELECIGLDSDRLMVHIPCSNPDDIARFYIFQHTGAYTAYFSRDLPKLTREQIRLLSPEIAFSNYDTVKVILAADKPCEQMHIGKSYVFPDTLKAQDFADVVSIERDQRVVHAIVVDGEIVSSCESSRENNAAGEAWVYTAEAFRGRGYARQVTAAWGCDLQRKGKIPFYSHVVTNLASQAVARSLGLVQFIADVGYG